jgi:hypothetical protein
MESTQSTEIKEPIEFEVRTSIGTVRIFATARNRLNILSPENSSPWIMATVERSGDGWRLDSRPGFLINGKEQPAPPTLADELVTLGRTWAESHPEEFERAGNREFSIMLESCDEMFDPLLEELQRTEHDFRSMLAEPEFMRSAPAMLRSRFEDAAKMVHAMKLQVEATAETIDDAAEKEED